MDANTINTIKKVVFMGRKGLQRPTATLPHYCFGALQIISASPSQFFMWKNVCWILLEDITVYTLRGVEKLAFSIFRSANHWILEWQSRDFFFKSGLYVILGFWSVHQLDWNKSIACFYQCSVLFILNIKCQENVAQNKSNSLSACFWQQFWSKIP